MEVEQDTEVAIRMVDAIEREEVAVVEVRSVVTMEEAGGGGVQSEIEKRHAVIVKDTDHETATALVHEVEAVDEIMKVEEIPVTVVAVTVVVIEVVLGIVAAAVMEDEEMTWTYTVAEVVIEEAEYTVLLVEIVEVVARGAVWATAGE